VEARARSSGSSSTKAARSIWEKLQGQFGGETPDPKALLRKRPQTLRKAGLSNAKVEFLRDRTAGADHRLDLKRLWRPAGRGRDRRADRGEGSASGPGRCS
jgi:3-methyladenine DNA glycosylase/8-oxoguanine DNA glycosylase